MNKRFLVLLLSLSLFLCLFAISVSATEIDYNEKVTLSDGTVLPIYDEDNNPLIWFIKDENATGMEKYASVATNRNKADNEHSYVTFNINSTYGTNQLHDVYIKYWDTETSTYISYGEGTQVVSNLRGLSCWSVGTWRGDYIEYVYYPSTIKGSGTYRYSTSLIFVDISLSEEFTGFSEQAFRGCTSLKTVKLPTKNEYALTCTNSNLFAGCTALEKIEIPDCVTGIQNTAFSGCTNLKEVKITKNSKITYIESTAFANCTSLTYFYLPPMLTGLTTNTGGDKGTFYNCTNLYFVNNPDDTAKPDVYFFPENLALTGWNFRNCNNMNETLVVGTGITAIGENTLRAGTSVKNIVCLGNITSLNRENLNNSTYPLTYWLCNNEQGEVTATNSSRYSYVICNAEGNELHLEDPRKTQVTEADCVNNQKKTTTCFCGTEIGVTEVENTALGHEYDVSKGGKQTSIKYDNYFSSGTLYTKCARCENESETDTNPIITSFVGFSIKEQGGGITFKYTFDADAIKKFESVNSTKVELGFVVAVKDFIGEVSPLDTDGTPLNDKVIKVKVSDENHSYTGVEFVLKGNWDKTVKINGVDVNVKDVQFYMAGYIIQNGTVQYINSGKTSDVSSTVKYSQFE